MKVTLDLTALVARGALTQAEADRLKTLAAQQTGSTGANILLAFGIVAIVLGVGALVPSVYTAIALGGLLFGVGMALLLSKSFAWELLARICLTIGALVLSGGIVMLFEGSQPVVFGLALALAAAAVVAQSGLLAAISVLTLSTVLSAASGWYLIPEATLSIVAFSVLALILFLVSLRLPPVYERLALIAARTAVLLVNLGFLIGSIFGDSRTGIPGLTFSVAWAVVLIVVGLWAMRANRPWVVTVAAVFGGIHFFVQWFAYLGANPLSILGGGLLLIIFGVLLIMLIRRSKLIGVPPATGVGGGATPPA